MKTMTRFLLTIGIASLGFTFLLSLDFAALMEKHRAALAADPQALAKVERFQMTGSVNKYGLTGEATFMVATPDRFGVEHKFGEWREKAILMGKTGDVLSMMGWARPLQADELTEYQAIRYILGLHYLQNLDKLDVRLQESAEAITARFTMEEGISLEIRFSPTTYLIQSFSFNGADGNRRTFLIEDYREEKGVKFPVKVTDQALNPAVYEIKEIQVGGGNDAFYNIPAEGRGFTPGEKKPLRLTLRKYFGVPMVSAWINDSPALTFLVDLGLPFSVIDKTIAAQLGLMPEGRLVKAVKYPISEFGFVGVPVFQFREGGLTAEFKNRIFLTTDMIPTCANVQLAIHGILGCDFFRQNNVVLDLKGDSLRIVHPKDFATEKQGTPISLVNQQGIFKIPITLGKTPVSLEVTTSTDNVVLLSDKCPAAADLEKQATKKVDALSLGLCYGLSETLFKLDDMKCGEAENIPCIAHVLHYPENHPLQNHRSGWAGCGLWKRFTCYFDFPKAELSLVPNDDLKSDDCFNSTGLYVVKSGGKIVVHFISPGSPAEKAGLQVGDVITEILENPAEQFVFERIYYNFCKPKGETIPLKVLRGEETISISIVTESPF